MFANDKAQLKAAEILTQSPVAVISGRGGCGKTFVVNEVLSKVLEMKKNKVDVRDRFTDVNMQSAEDSDDSYKRDDYTANWLTSPSSPAASSCQPDSQGMEELTLEDISEDERKEVDAKVLLTAPTGRAASILGKGTGLPAYTLHSVIYSFLRWKNEGNQVEWKFNKVCLLVCDECSLIPVRVFSKLISILNQYSQLQQIILLGDIYQLPSIEPGNLLSDVHSSLMQHGVCVTLETNHRTESELIDQNAINILNRQLPDHDETRGFISVQYQSKSNDEDSETNAVTQAVNRILQEKFVPDHRASQFIAFRNKDCMVINERCSLYYNEHSIKDKHGKLDFRSGDKVCVKRNVLCFDEFNDEEVRLCNGEIFFIEDIIEEINNRNEKALKFILEDGEKKMKIDFKSLKSAKLSHAWARTIHTFQVAIFSMSYLGLRTYRKCSN